MDRHGLATGAVADAGAFLARLTRLDPAALIRLRPADPAGGQRTELAGGQEIGGQEIGGQEIGGQEIGDEPVGGPRIALWARLPWGTLVTRTVPGGPAADVTVLARDLLAELARDGATLPARRDQQWRWPLPPRQVEVIERVPVGAVREIGAAAEGTLRAAAQGALAGRSVGERAVRDALLDHVAIVVTPGPRVPSRGAFFGGSASGALGEEVAENGEEVAENTAPVEVPQRLVQAVIRMGFLGSPNLHRPDEPDGRRPDEEAHVQILRAGRWVGLAAAYGTGWLRPASEFTVRVSF
jgi:hypothetical protein